MGKDRRAELAAKAGLKKAQFGAVGGAAKAAGDVGSAYFEAEAKKEVARQLTHQVALQQNQGILHELDRPFLDYSAQVGTAKKPAEVNVTLSILGAYMLGVMAEKGYNDFKDINANAKPGQFTEHVLVMRAPLTEVSGGQRLGVGAAPGSGAPMTAAEADERIKLEEAKRLNRLVRLSRGDFGALFG